MANGWLSARTMAAFAGGTAAALLASRLLPPVVAQGIGAARAAAGRDPFDVLTEDHRQVIELMRQMEATQSNATFRRGQMFLRLKRNLTKHALAEEDVLYPMVRDMAGQSGEARDLYADHAEMKMLLHGLEQTSTDDPGWVGRVRELRRLVEEHAHQEEEEVFPRLRRMLDKDATYRLSREVQREKALVL